MSVRGATEGMEIKSLIAEVTNLADLSASVRVFERWKRNLLLGSNLLATDREMILAPAPESRSDLNENHNF
jgi:hypothetical protein